jgi:RNA polymerase sigma-70 factor (ECF subfamily)
MYEEGGMRVKKGTVLAKDLQDAFKQGEVMTRSVIFRIVRDIDSVEDVLQNTYIKAWKNRDKFKGGSSLKTWVYTIAKNEAFTFLKKRRRYAIHIETLATKEEYNSAIYDDPYYELRASNIEKAVEAITSLKLKTVLKRKMIGESEKEIALDLGIPEGTVKSRYRRAKAYLVKNTKEI